MMTETVAHGVDGALDRAGGVHAVPPGVAVAFFRETMPFKELDDQVLLSLARHCRVDFFPKGTRLLTDNETEVTHLYLIQRGGVRAFITDADGKVVLKDYRGVGANIGALGIITGRRANLNIEMIEDTFCYLLPREVFLKLIRENSTVAHFFLKSFSEKVVDTAYKELRNNRLARRANEDLYLFNATAGDLIKPLHTVAASASIQEAAAVMARHGIGSLLIFADEDPGGIIGIITDTDLRMKVVAEGRDYRQPVTSIMSGPLKTVPSRALCFDVLLKMMATGIHHLGVEQGGRVVGVVTSHDIMVQQGNSPYYLFKEISSQSEFRGIYPLSQKIPDIVRSIINEGAKAGNIARMIAILNDKILSRILDLLHEKLGPAPVKYCWLLMGSEGRREQTFKTDQDNAIIYADPVDAAEMARAESYFHRFATEAIDHLLNCGYPLCQGDIMARNPRWCQPLSVWKGYFEDWIHAPEKVELMHSTIFFDFRCGYGSEQLAARLRDHLIAQVKKQEIFIYHLGRHCIANRAPLSFFNNFIVEKDGEHKNRLDIKIRGLTPFVDFARVLALRYGVRETNTLDRLRILQGENHISQELYRATVDAYELQMQLRVIHQLGQIEKGVLPDNFIHPEQLSNLEKRMLKDAFTVIERIQTVLDKMFPAV
jgi:CBS domain-containing protein